MSQKIKINYDDFLWMLKSGDFNQSTTGILFEVDKNSIQSKFNIGNKYNLTMSNIIENEDENIFDFKIINGRMKNGITGIIADLKVIKAKKGELLEIENLDKFLTFKTKNHFQRKKTRESTILIERENYKNQSLKSDMKTLENINSSILKEVLDAFKKTSSVITKGIIIFRVKENQASFVVGDVDNTKRFVFNIGEIIDEDREIILKYNFSIVETIFKHFKKFDFSFDELNFQFKGENENSKATLILGNSENLQTVKNVEYFEPEDDEIPF